MKSFQQFQEDMKELEGVANSVISNVKQTADRLKKTPTELKSVRKGMTGKVNSVLGKKLDVPSLISQVPNSGKIATMIKKNENKKMQSARDPSTQQRYDQLSGMLKSLSKE